MRTSKTFLLVFTLALLIPGLAQAQFIKSKKQEIKINWQNLSPEVDGVYGIAIDQAYKQLAGKKAKKEVVVAIIGPGIDAEHEDLQGSIWQNKKEKPNSKDDDKNGYIDDINGWNYLGNTKGEVLEDALSFGNREFFRLKDEYGSIQFDGKNYFIPNEAEGKMIKVADPKDKTEYAYFNGDVRKISSFGPRYSGVEIAKMARIYATQIDKELKQKYPDKKDFTSEDFISILNPDEPDSLKMISTVFLNIPFNMVGDSWNRVVKYMNTTQKESGEKSLEKLFEGVNPNDRVLVGDNPYNIKDTKYGNNILLTENAGSGTMYAGIIAAQRANELGIDGIADNARIMILRTNPTKGDAYWKDVARAIRYAVDNGAEIVQLSSSTISISPYGEQKTWVEDALAYADSKGILIVQPVLDESYDMDQKFFFPNRKLSNKKTLQNIITVAASDINGNPLMTTNFGIESLDVYAPGKDIYSSYTGDSYRTESGSDMAASVVAGVAALIKSYYPSLSGAQIRDVLMKSVTDRKDAEVEKQAMIKYGDSDRMSKDLYLFEDLCVSGGIVNAEKALKLAGEIAK